MEIDEIKEKYIESGKIAAKVRNFGLKLIKPGVKLVEIAEAIESEIINNGALPAFPVNISLNSIAAHYTPSLDDKTIISENDYVKLDIGVHVDGYIADTAVTIKPSGKDKLIECVEKILEESIKIIKPGVLISEIGNIAESIAEKYGYNIVRNLTGHCLERYNLHTGFTIPNIRNNSTHVFETGKAYAIEPFCTSGKGYIKDSSELLIFCWKKNTATRLYEARKILELSKEKYKGLPFAKRWLEKDLKINKFLIETSLRQLISSGALHPYYVLKEISNSSVVQAEHTVFVEEKPIIITL
ncbi:MAG: type II methionyl aminopeptidase [Candidatus Aenigmatarchaeota archaeon]|nr:type II methionyl aminopeptidase [Candidatus Aenigmarchaeota archaeon]